MCENRFFICEHCGNIVGLIHNSGVPLMCCGQKMTPLVAGTVEASKEKHIPVVKVEGNVVTVEPGIYLNGRFGCRIEDMGCVLKDGFENFTTLSKDLVELFA